MLYTLTFFIAGLNEQSELIPGINWKLKAP